MAFETPAVARFAFQFTHPQNLDELGTIGAPAPGEPAFMRPMVFDARAASR